MIFKITDEGIDYSGGSSNISTYNAKIHVITASEEGRPDIIAYNFYDEPSLWWAICMANDMNYGFNMQYRFKAYDSDLYQISPEQAQTGTSQIPVIPNSPTSYDKDVVLHNGHTIHKCYRSEMCIGRSIIIPSLEAIKAFMY